MSGEAEVLPGKQFDTSGNGEVVDLSKLNSLGRPFVRVLEDAITERELANSIVTEIGDLRTDLTTEASSRITADAALALWQQTVEAAYGENLINVGVTLSAHADSLGNLDTYWGVALNANGQVIGSINLSGSVDSETGTPTSDFVIAANKFKVANVSDGTVGAAVFEVEAVTGVVKFGGIVVDPAVGLYSADYVEGSAGYKIGLDGKAEFSDVIIRSELGESEDGMTWAVYNNPNEFLKITTNHPIANADIALVIDTDYSDGHEVLITPLSIRMTHNTTSETISITAERIRFDGGSAIRGAVGQITVDDDLRVGGNLRAHVRVNNYTGTSQTAALIDRSAIVEMDNASANEFSLPLEATVAFEDGDCFDVRQEGAGQTTVKGVAGVLVNGVDGGSVEIAGQFQAVSVYKRGTNDWGVVGGNSV